MAWASAKSAALQTLGNLAGIDAGLEAALLKRLHISDAEQAAFLIDALVLSALHKEPRVARVYECMLIPQEFALALGHDWLRKTREASVELVYARYWLQLAWPIDPPEVEDATKLVAQPLREMPLGRRRALARIALPADIVHLLQDPDDIVINNLLHNPKLTEDHILRLASRRPTVAAPLHRLMQHRFWMQRYRVKLALAQNPHLAEDRAGALLVCLRYPDLQSVASVGSALTKRQEMAAMLLGLWRGPEL